MKGFESNDDDSIWLENSAPQTPQPDTAFFSTSPTTYSSYTIHDHVYDDSAMDPTQLTARLFPSLNIRRAPAIPIDNPEKIRQVKIPLDDDYRPEWIRKEGNEREGWCGYYERGTWANLKHSNYSYHMLRRHGICKALKRQFDPPQNLYMVSDEDGSRPGPPVLYGLCHRCQQHIELTGNPTLECEFPRLAASWYSHCKDCIVSDNPNS